ncbi:hypothetical protein SESBI_50797, partial [Sesbania bispinosa]
MGGEEEKRKIRRGSRCKKPSTNECGIVREVRWRMTQEDNALWYKVLKAKYGVWSEGISEEITK